MFQDLIVNSRRLAELYQFKFIKPSHLLHTMTGNETARHVITRQSFDIHVMRSVLIKGFKAHKETSELISGRVAASELFEACIENCQIQKDMPYEEVIHALLLSIAENGYSDPIVRDALNKSFLGSAFQNPLTQAPQNEGNSLRDLPRECEEELMHGQVSLDDLLAENARSGDAGNFEAAPANTEEHTGFKIPAGEEPQGLKETFKQGRMKAAEKDKKTPPLSPQAEEARKQMLSAQRNITELAKAGLLDVVVGRDREINRVIEVLMRRRKPNVILVAEPGVGKSALVEGLATKLISRDCPDPVLAMRSVVEVSLTSMVGGTRLRGEFEERMDMMIKHAEAERQILFIDEIHTLMGAGSAARSMDGANILKPVLARDSISLIGATTPEEAEILREDKALMRRFEVIYIDEPLRDQMEVIIRQASKKFLEKHEVSLPDSMVEPLLDFGERYIEHRRNPDRSFDMLDLAAVSARLRGDTEISPEDLRHAVRRLGGAMMSVDALSLKAKDKFLEHLQARVFGQGEAIQEIVDQVYNMKSGIGQTEPIHLIGPSGIGKEHAARKTSEFYGKSLTTIKPRAGNYIAEEIEKRIGYILAADPDAAIAIESASAQEGKEIKSYLSYLLAADSRKRSFSIRKPLIFIIEHGEFDDAAVYGFNTKTVHSETGSDSKSIIFKGLVGAELQAAVKAIIAELSTRRVDAGLPDIECDGVMKKVYESIAGESVSYRELLARALKLC